MRCVRIAFCWCFNSHFLQLAGVAIVVTGFMLKFNSGILEDEVAVLLNKVVVDNALIGTTADTNVIIMIVSGFLIMALAVVGFIGVCKTIKCCLWAVSIEFTLNVWAAEAELNRAHTVETTSIQRWFNVLTLNQRWVNVVSTLCACWNGYFGGQQVALLFI